MAIQKRKRDKKLKQKEEKVKQETGVKTGG